MTTTDGPVERVDPITLAVVQGVLQSTQRAMTATMEKTGRSTVYAIARDYSNTLFDGYARMILQGEDLPAHLGSLILATKAVVRYFKDNIEPGDILYHNDPMYDGSHIVDWCMYKPIFVDDELVFWAVSKGHVIDAGGPVPGSYNMHAKEIYAEGLRIPPVKIVQRGVRRYDVINLLLTNVRSRQKQAGDLNAQLGAVTIAERRLTALLERYGVATVRGCIERLLDLAELHMRSIIAELPDGNYQASVVAEDTGHGQGDQIISAHVTIVEEELTIRLEAPPQLEFYTNSYRSNTLSGVYAGLLMFALVEPPFNEGLYRPVDIDFGPPGTMVNAREPAPHVNCTGGPQETICDVVRLALSEAAATRAHAGWNHTWAVNLAGKHPSTGESWVELLMCTLVGGGGAVYGLSDGWHAVGAQASMGALQTGDSEFIELLVPIIVHRLAIVQDSAGPGRWRGGCGLITEIEPIGHDMTVIAWGEGAKYPVAGAVGAKPALIDEKLGRGWHVRNGKVVREVRENDIFTIAPGDRYITRNQGGGGAGDAFERAPELVHDDVWNQKISVRGAEVEYGVILDPTSLAIDWEQTQMVRAQSSD